MVTTTASLGTARSLPLAEHWGVNGADVKSAIKNWLDPNMTTVVAGLAPPLIRYAGGTTANYWRYRTSSTDTSWGGYTEGGAKNPDGTPITLTLDRFKEICDAAGAVPVFDLNMACDAAVYGTSFNKYAAKPYGPPNLTETLAFLDAVADIGLPIKYLELGNEFPGFADLPVKTNYNFAPQASGASNPTTGVPYTSTSFPAGYVWDYNALPTAAGTLNVNGQDEYLLGLGKAMTGFPEPADAVGLGAGGAGWLYGVRASKWIKAIKTWATGRGLPTPKFLVNAARKPTGLGDKTKKLWNRGLIAGLDLSGPGKPDYFVLHPYWKSTLSYTYGQPVPSIDPANVGYSAATVDEYVSSAQEAADDVTAVHLSPGTDPAVTATFWYTLQPLLNAGIRLATTEYGVLEQVNLFAPPITANTGVDQGHGGFGQLLTTLAATAYRTEMWPVDLMTVHSLNGNTVASAAITANSTGLKTLPAYAYGLNTPRAATGITIAGNSLTVDDGSLTAADANALVVVSGITAAIFSVQSATTATLTNSPGDTTGDGTIEQPVTVPQFRLAGAAFPLPGPPTTPWNKSATGYAVAILSRCARGMDTYTPLAFSGSPKVNDTGSTNRGLIGGMWTGPSSRKAALVANLRRDDATVTLPAGLQGLPAAVVTAGTLATPITAQTSMAFTPATTGTTVTVPAHSFLFVNAQAASGAAVVAGLADPALTGGSTTTTVQIATYSQAQALAATAQAAAITAAGAASVPLTKYTLKGVIPVATAPNTVGAIDPTGQADGQVLRTSSGASTGWSFAAAYPAMAQLTDAGPSMGTYTSTGSIAAASSRLTDAGSPNFTTAMTGRTLTITAANNASVVGCVFTATYFSSTKLDLTYVSGNGGVNPLPPGSSIGAITYTVSAVDQMVPFWDAATSRWVGKPISFPSAITGQWQPDDSGHAAWTVDLPTTTSSIASGRVTAARAKLVKTAITTFSFHVGTAATTLTAGAPNKLYVWNDAGTALLGSYDVLAGDNTVFTTTGAKTVTLTAASTGSLSGLTVGSKVQAGFLFNGTGTLAVNSSAGTGATMVNRVGAGGGSARYGLYGAAGAYASSEPAVPLPTILVPGTTVGIPQVILD